MRSARGRGVQMRSARGRGAAARKCERGPRAALAAAGRTRNPKRAWVLPMHVTDLWPVESLFEISVNVLE